jgi:LuxR family maltose regulon positive regulatory protein
MPIPKRKGGPPCGKAKEDQSGRPLFPCRNPGKTVLPAAIPADGHPRAAGFGKSTALRRFFEQNVSPSTPVLWHTFLAGSLRLLALHLCPDRSGRPKMRRRAGRHRPARQRRAARVAEALENLECNEETYLVLDSFELSGLPSPETLLVLLSKQGSEGLHIVVVPRELAASVLLSNHRVYRLEAADFTFSAADTEGYFRLAGLDVARGQALAVHQATGGWVLALHMQIMAYLKSGAFSSADTYQLIQQVVWDGLTDAARELFLSVSILPHFPLSQAVSLTGQDVEQTEQLMLEQAAFVHFDEETHSFYLHTIFAAFLRNKFQLLPEARRKAIYLAAGDLSARAGDRTNTLQFYYYSGAWEKLLALPLTSYDLADVLDETTKPMIVDVVEHTPYEIKARYPLPWCRWPLPCSFCTKTKSWWPPAARSSGSSGRASCPSARRTDCWARWSCCSPSWSTTASTP